ncbi:MAG: sugar-binding protein [Bacteroidota bacterium]
MTFGGTIRRALMPLLLIAACWPVALWSQSGMDFEEFKRRADPYFAEELLSDVRNAMPLGASYRIWGWDVGDFSGDGVYDLAVSLHVSGSRKRECLVYMFVDVDGFLVNISKMPFPFVDLPLEVGVVIRDTSCYVTVKRKSEDWSILGYRFREGAVVLVDQFVTNRVESLGHESYRSFQTLSTRERFLRKDDEAAYESQYMTIPCYARGRQVFAGFVPEATVQGIDHVTEGSYWWTGEEDASFRARMVYDDDYLYLRVNVRDSNVVTGWCDTCVADHLELSLDVSPEAESGVSRNVSISNRTDVNVRHTSDSGLYTIVVRVGDFADRLPRVIVRTTDDLDPTQNQARRQIRAVSARTKDGYVVKVRIPFVLLGYQKAPIDERRPTEFGCTVAVHDVDNEFRAEEFTVVASSPLKYLDPSTYGVVRFIPEGVWYGESSNIYGEAVLNALRELGF